MLSSSGKRRASSPLGSEPGKTPRLGLTHDEVSTLNENLRFMTQAFAPVEVSTSVLAATFQQVALELRNTGRATVMSWMTDFKSWKEQIDLLSPEVRQDLVSVWGEARKNGDWERFASHFLFHFETPTVTSGGASRYLSLREEQQVATEKSWYYPFKGDAATGLWEHIETHYNRSDSKVYAPYVAVVQSSGMGKSRAVDELAKDRFVIPLNLREIASTGYPPADNIVRDYLATAGSPDVAFQRVSAFLEALFEHTTDRLLSPDSSLNYIGFSRKFRTLMTEGQTMTKHNEFRQDFYNRVVEKAEQLETLRTVSHADSTPTQSQRLQKFLDLFSKLLYDTPPSSIATRNEKLKAEPRNSVPLVVLAFDEAHTLTPRHQATGKEWSTFHELLFVLRRFHDLPIFSLFLSTTGKISQFTPAMEEDLSRRIVEDKLMVIQPYTDLGFDPLARKIAADGSWRLEQLTKDSHICMLGRPLFGTRYLEGTESIQHDIIQFAAELSNDQALACLSQRLPIEFNSTTYTSQEKERKQVQGHLRVCLKIDAAFGTMTSTSSSEPILSEAAYFIMQKESFNAPKALKSVMEGFSISKGDRGEFLVLLLLTLARDATVGAANRYGQPIKGKRWFGLTDFLHGQVFRKATVDPSLVDAASTIALSMFSKDFPNAQLHFNHFIKVHEYKCLETTLLLLLQGREAAVLCANNQKAAAAVNVFLKDGTQLVRDNAGLILYQIKNDLSYSDEPQQKLFDAMDPHELDILKVPTDAVPLIKIVFALAARKPYLSVVRRDQTTSYSAVIYEIWCAGMSPDILEPIKEIQMDIWESLLQASNGWKELYKDTLEVPGNLRQSATPGAALDNSHFSHWATPP